MRGSPHPAYTKVAAGTPASAKGGQALQRERKTERIYYDKARLESELDYLSQNLSDSISFKR
ncbi:MAG: hypothetical protein PHW27_12550 [Melioribacteraceae bacterium]|nr:hypothetical protein [Melioribacteraceae bacterium]